MTDLVLAVVALAAVVTVLVPQARARGDPPERISPRARRALPRDDDHQLDRETKGGSP